MKNKCDEKSNKKRWIILILLLLLAFIVPFLPSVCVSVSKTVGNAWITIFASKENDKNNSLNKEKTIGGGYDDSNGKGQPLIGDGVDVLSKEEIEAKLNQQVKDGYMAVSYNSNPVLRKGTLEFVANFINSKNNKMSQVCEISLKDTGEIIFKSNIVEPGKYLAQATLAENLPIGTHECLVKVFGLNPQTKEIVAMVRGPMKLVVTS